MVTLEPMLRRRHRVEGCPEKVLDELMKQLRNRFEQRVYPDLFLGPVLNLDVEYAKGNHGISLSHFVWHFFSEMCKFMLRNPVACEDSAGNWDIKTRCEKQIEREMQQFPGFVKPLTMALGLILWVTSELYVWGFVGLIIVQRIAKVLRRRILGGWYVWLLDDKQ
jgi:hypothetical protein